MRDSASTQDPVSLRTSWSLKALAVLFKLRVVGLLLFAAVGGAFLASAGWPGAGPLLTLIITGGVTSAGASALNQYWERSADARMTRTRERPLVVGSVSPTRRVPIIALIMVIAPAAGVAFFNPSLSIFLLLGAFIYLVIYTLWLKPRTPLNIIVGGAAGCAAVLSGSAAVGHWNHPAAVTLALTLFLWTPTHFWSLAIIYREDYAAGGIPMLPVRISPRAASWWVLLHTLTTTFGALALGALPSFGWLYRVVASVAAAALISLNAGLILKPEPDKAARLFKASNAFLGTILLLILLETLQ